MNLGSVSQRTMENFLRKRAVLIAVKLGSVKAEDDDNLKVYGRKCYEGDTAPGT